MWIKNLSRLIRNQLTKHHGMIHICDRCLTYFHTSAKLQTHEVDCEKMNKCKIKLPTPQLINGVPQLDNSYKVVKFKNFKNKEKVPFVVYADFESILKKLDGVEKKLNVNEPSAVCYYFMCRYDESK